MREFLMMIGKDDVIYLIWLVGLFTGMFIPLWLVIMLIGVLLVVFKLPGCLVQRQPEQPDDFCKFMENFTKIVGDPLGCGLAMGQAIVLVFGINI